MYSFLTLVAWKCTNCTQKSYNWSFWPIFGHLNPQNGRLYYQRSIFRGSYSVKSFHKLVLQENVSNSVFFELKVHLQCLKVGVRGQNLQNFNLKWPIKSLKMLQTWPFLGCTYKIRKSAPGFCELRYCKVRILPPTPTFRHY